eukprot:2514958-Pleurochrysis_carterae.AAC.3
MGGSLGSILCYFKKTRSSLRSHRMAGKRAVSWHDGGDAGEDGLARGGALGEPRAKYHVAVALARGEGDVDGGALFAELHRGAIGQVGLKSVEEEVAKRVLVDALLVNLAQLLQRGVHRLVKRREVEFVKMRRGEPLPDVLAQLEV